MHVLIQRGLTAAALGSLGLTMAAVASGPAAAAAAPCVREVLRLPAGAVSGGVRTTDPTGRYQVGTYRDANEGDHTVVWRDGAPAEIVLPGNSGAADVNARGDVIGGTNPGDGQWHDWRRPAGQTDLVNLPAPAGTAGADALAINARGQIAGESYEPDGWNRRAVVWSATNVVRTLPQPAGYNETRVTGIDDDGTVVGTVYDWDIPAANIRAARAIAWFPEGTWRLLPGTATDGRVEANSIRHGAVVGTQNDDTVLVWSARSGNPTVLTTGSVAGDISTTGSITLRKFADKLLYQPGAGYRTLPQDDAVMGSALAVSLTDDDQVYGTDSDNGVAKPIRWTC
jgi:hypothetical protein